MAIGNPDFLVFSGLSHQIEATHAASGPNPWIGSPFQWISEVQSGRKGAIGKRLVRGWAEGEGMQVAGKSSRGHDFQVNGKRVVVKLSLVWSDRRFVFQQIKDQPYDAGGAAGARAPASAAVDRTQERHLARADPQHTGQAGHDTKWLRLPGRRRPPAWLTSGYGAGTLCARQAGPGIRLAASSPFDSTFSAAASSPLWPRRGCG